MDEVISWGVLLRWSKYLTENNFSGKPKKIYREFLSNQLVNFTTIVQEKKEECSKEIRLLLLLLLSLYLKLTEPKEMLLTQK